MTSEHHATHRVDEPARRPHWSIGPMEVALLVVGAIALALLTARIIADHGEAIIVDHPAAHTTRLGR